ncbi:MAG: hypothetical protein LBP59_11140 [Planctomycetaceae bacterium]|jgi:NTP pyrophosphatase (non-canonical NTP hydrolase)|nr:hypothetical protein [Planctomycetaceae bacterium]
MNFNYDAFIAEFNKVAKLCFDQSATSGFWDEERNNGECIALMHSELSEALEGLRHGNPASEHIPAFSAVEEELADLIIRLMDLAYGRNWDIAKAMQAKMEFNKTRQHKHGKTF